MLALAALVFWLLGLLVDVMVDRISPETEAKISRAMAIKWAEEKPHSLENGNFSSLSKALTVDLGAFGVFGGTCRSIGADA